MTVPTAEASNSTRQTAVPPQNAHFPSGENGASFGALSLSVGPKQVVKGDQNPQPNGAASHGPPTTQNRAVETTPPVLVPIFPIPKTQTLVKQTHEIIIPSHSTWFSLDAIHFVEKRSLPEFFNTRHPSKTPDIYKHHRNFMVNCFRINPHEYLSITACRKNLVGDVAGIVRIHGFLEQWGLINYQIEPDTRPSLVGPTFRGHFRITAHTPNENLNASLPLSDVSSAPRPPPASPPKPIGQQLELEDAANRRSASVEPDSNSPRKQKETIARLHKRFTSFREQRAQRESRAPPILCSSCGVTCGRTVEEKLCSARWHCVRNPSVDVCGSCFDDGRFPSSYLSCDFVRLGASFSMPEDIALQKLDEAKTSGKPINVAEFGWDEDDVDLGDLYDGDEDNGGSGVAGSGVRLPWSHEETFLLLEGVEHFEQDWTRIAFHIGTRSKEECVVKFLGMTIIEPILIEEGAAGVLAFRESTELLNQVDEEGEDGRLMIPAKSRKRKAGKPVAPVWPVSVLESLPCTPIEDPTMAFVAVLASAVDQELGKAVASVAVVTSESERNPQGSHHSHHHHVGHHVPLSPTRKHHSSSLRSPKLGASHINEFPLDVRAAELQLKKANILLTRYERKASLVEKERIQKELEKRTNIMDSLGFRKDVWDVRKKLKIEEIATFGATDGSADDAESENASQNSEEEDGEPNDESTEIEAAEGEQEGDEEEEEEEDLDDSMDT